MRSYNDDLVMSFAIGCWVRDTVIVESLRGVEYNKEFVSAISTSKTRISTTIKGMHGHENTQESLRNEEAAKHVHEYFALLKG